jgi:hypothetical protein
VGLRNEPAFDFPMVGAAKPPNIEFPKIVFMMGFGIPVATDFAWPSDQFTREQGPSNRPASGSAIGMFQIVLLHLQRLIRLSLWALPALAFILSDFVVLGRVTSLCVELRAVLAFAEQPIGHLWMAIEL